MAKFLVDENLSPLIASDLRKQGYNAKTIRELDLIGESDEVVLNFAQNKGWIIITADLEFGKFFYERFGEIGMIILRSRLQSTSAMLKILNSLGRKKLLKKFPRKHLLLLANSNNIRLRRFPKE